MKSLVNVSDNVNWNRRIWRNRHGRENLACHSSQTNSRSGIALVCQWYGTPIAIMTIVLQWRAAQKHWPWQGTGLEHQCNWDPGLPQHSATSRSKLYKVRIQHQTTRCKILAGKEYMACHCQVAGIVYKNILWNTSWRPQAQTCLPRWCRMTRLRSYGTSWYKRTKW